MMLCSVFAPSTHAASSNAIGTVSMKFFIIHMQYGSDVADMNSTTPKILSIRCSVRNSLYTGIITVVIGRQDMNRIVYMNVFPYFNS